MVSENDEQNMKYDDIEEKVLQDAVKESIEQAYQAGGAEAAGEPEAGEDAAAESEVEDTAAESAEAGEQETEELDEEAAAGDDQAETTEGEAEASDAPGDEGKGGLFRGRKKKEKKDPRDEKIAELTDRLQRQMAEFDNFRKRTEKEKTNMYAIGARDVIEKVLPVADNFERGLAAAESDPAEDPFLDGMSKIYKQLVTMLEDLGVTPIEAVGAEFDPNLHNAVMHVEDEEAGENTVVEEFQKGYMYKDMVIRHSMVKVAN